MSGNKLRIEELPELKLFLHMLKDQGRYDSIINTMESSKAIAVAADDDDIAMTLNEATLASKNVSECLAWFKDILERMTNLDDSSSRIDEWQIWKALLSLEANQSTNVNERKR